MAVNKNWVFILLTLAVFTGSLLNYLDRVPKRHYCDFRVYYKAGQDIIQGKNIYIREKEEITPFKYSPFFAFVFAPLSLPPIKASAAIFFTINFFLTILLFKLSFDLAHGSGDRGELSSRQRLLIYSLTLICSFRYILLVWDSGQSSILMCSLVLLSVSFLYKDKWVGAGAFLASSILIKYTPAIFLPYLLFQKKFKAFSWVIVFAVLFLLLPVMIVGLQKDMMYLTSWIPSIINTSLDKVSYLDNKNQSIYSLLLRFLTPTRFNIQLVSLNFEHVLFWGHIVALMLFLAVFIPGKSRRDMAIDPAVLLICMSLFNPNGWMLNYVSLIPAYMILVREMMINKGKDRFVLFSVVAAFILTNVMSKDLVGVRAEDLGCAYSFTTWGALILYTALLKLKFART